MRIGELARRTAVSERLLRYCEEQSLLHPTRLPSGDRDHAESDVEQVSRIRMLLPAGLPTTLIAEILPCVRQDGGQLVPYTGLVAALTEERTRIDAMIDALTSSRRVLNSVIAAGETDPYELPPPADARPVPAADRPWRPTPRRG